MDLICPDSSCSNHAPNSSTQWFDYHGAYLSCGRRVQRYRCRSCRRTFSERTLSIDYWTHFSLDYAMLIHLFAAGCSVRALSRLFSTSVKTIQNRFSRLARAIIPTLSSLQHSIDLRENLVADGLENFFVSQDFPNNIHVLVGKRSQYTYGFNYALMRRKGRKTEAQAIRCEALYPRVDFDLHTIKRGFKELTTQMNRVAKERSPLVLYTDEKQQYTTALAEDATIEKRRESGGFAHVQINSKLPRTLRNDLFSVNYIDREIRKDVPEYRRETVCFGRNVVNGLERFCVYLFHHNFIKRYRIRVTDEERTHAEVAGISEAEVRTIREDVVKRRRFIRDKEIESGGFFESLWRKQIPAPLKEKSDYLPKFAVA